MKPIHLPSPAVDSKRLILQTRQSLDAHPTAKLLHWYLESTYPESYSLLQNEVKQGKHILHPIDAYQNMVRSPENLQSYRHALDLAYGCFQQEIGLAKEATRFSIKWQPDCKKQVQKSLVGMGTSHALDDNQNLHKDLAYACTTAQLLAHHWKYPSLYEAVENRLQQHRHKPIRTEKVWTTLGENYWHALSSVPHEWIPLVWDAMHIKSAQHYTVKGKALSPELSLDEMLDFGSHSLMERNDPTILHLKDVLKKGQPQPAM